MEICYYWIDKYGSVIENMGYNFGAELTFSYNSDYKTLTIEENEQYIKGFFNLYSDEKIKNVTAVVGKNGVGKSSFLDVIKSPFIEDGFLTQKDEKENIYGDKRILVIKDKGKYEVIYHKELILNKVEKFKGNFEIKFRGYSTPKEYIARKAKFFTVAKHPIFNETACVYFSYAFDSNYYAQRTLENRKYFDISTKGLLNQIEDRYKPTNTFSYTEPNHLINRDGRFNIGFVREHSASENKKRIKLLSNKECRSFIKELDFFPSKVYLNLDYLLHRWGNHSFLDFSDSKLLLRSERKRKELNKIEGYTYDFIEKIDITDETNLMLAKQTYLRRIMDSYFEDVDRFIFFNEYKQFIIKEFSKDISDEDLEKRKDIIELMDFFHKSVEEALEKYYKTNEALGVLNANHFRDLTESYKKFLTFFEKVILSKDPLINVIKGNTELKATDDTEDGFEKQSTNLVPAGVIEIKLDSKGIALLGGFLEQYTAINTGSDFIKIDWGGFSTGEDALLGMYSRFFALNKNIKGENVIILLDEVEHSLHPDWQRAIIYNLIKFLPIALKGARNIQIIIATNVPFIIADIPTESVIYIEKINGKAKVVKKKGQTFASNIHSLLMGNFFMNTTIGKLSEKKIKDLVSILDENQRNKPKESGNVIERHYSLDEINKTINIIGEPVIRNKLKSMYTKKYNVRDEKEQEIKDLIANYKETERDIPENVKKLLEEIVRKTGGFKND